MTAEQHRQRHGELHRALDELIADYLQHNRSALPSSTSVLELLQWSYRETFEPTELEPNDGKHLRLVSG